MTKYEGNGSEGNLGESTGKKVVVYGPVVHYVGRRVMEMKVQGRRRRGRPKIRLLDSVRDYIRENEPSGDDVYIVLH